MTPDADAQSAFRPVNKQKIDTNLTNPARLDNMRLWFSWSQENHRQEKKT